MIFLDNILVNTHGIAGAANNLENTRDDIDNAFNTLWSEMQVLSSWRGSAGAAAQTTMHQFPPNNNARSSVLQSYIDMLQQQVNPNYTYVENVVNTSLADQFT